MDLWSRSKCSVSAERRVTFPLQVRSIPDIGPERLDKSSDLSKWLEDYFRCEEVQGLLSDLACFNLFTRGLTMNLASDG